MEIQINQFSSIPPRSVCTTREDTSEHVQSDLKIQRDCHVSLSLIPPLSDGANATPLFLRTRTLRPFAWRNTEFNLAVGAERRCNCKRRDNETTRGAGFPFQSVRCSANVNPRLAAHLSGRRIYRFAEGSHRKRRNELNCTGTRVVFFS